jgi:hypothetical protein
MAFRPSLGLSILSYLCPTISSSRRGNNEKWSHARVHGSGSVRDVRDYTASLVRILNIHLCYLSILCIGGSHFDLVYCCYCPTGQSRHPRPIPIIHRRAIPSLLAREEESLRILSSSHVFERQATRHLPARTTRPSPSGCLPTSNRLFCSTHKRIAVGNGQHRRHLDGTQSVRNAITAGLSLPLWEAPHPSSSSGHW